MRLLFGALFCFLFFVSESQLGGDRIALIDFYNGLDTPSQTNLGWNIFSPTLCGQFGVTCTDDRVVILLLIGKTLSGTIPTSVNLLTELQELVVATSQFHGSIPTQIGQLSKLNILTINGNLINGTIPTEIGNLQNLTQLTLQYNQLTGTIPTEFGQLNQLQFLQLSVNSLTGTIPRQVSTLPNLQNFGAIDNELTGTIPTFASESLMEINLSNNNLTGIIPNNLAVSSISFLSLDRNQLVGTIPKDLIRPSLLGFDVSFNMLTGTIPRSLFKIPTFINSVNLSHNKFTGTIPTEVGLRTELLSLRLNENYLTGKIPTELGSIFPDFIYLANNKFDCPINLVIGTETDEVLVEQLCDLLCNPNPCSQYEVCFIDGEEYSQTGCKNQFPACYSGEEGNPCVVVENSCDFPVAEKLTSTPMAELITSSSSLSFNNLTFVFHSDPVQDRIINTIFLGINTNPICVYPGPKFTKRFSNVDCKDIFTAFLTFQEALTCSFSSTDSNSTHFIYDSFIEVSGEDSIGYLRNQVITRTSTSRILFTIILPKEVEVSLQNLTAYSFILLEAAITAQSYDPISRIVNIEFTTSVQWPYSLFSLDSTFIGNLECLNEQPCFQAVLLEIPLDPQACSFSGDYSLTVGYNCRDGSSCDGQEQLNFTLISGDLCAKLTINSNIAGNLEGYSSIDYSETTIMYLGNEIAYFKAVVNSDVNINQVTIGRLAVVYDSNTQILADTGGNTFLGNRVSTTVLNIPSSAPNEIYFSFNLTIGATGLFNPEGQVDPFFTFTVEADLEIQYKTTFGKRDTHLETIRTTTSLVVENMITKPFSNVLEKSVADQSVISLDSSKAPLPTFFTFSFILLSTLSSFLLL